MPSWVTFVKRRPKTAVFALALLATGLHLVTDGPSSYKELVHISRSRTLDAACRRHAEEQEKAEYHR